MLIRHIVHNPAIFHRAFSFVRNANHMGNDRRTLLLFLPPKYSPLVSFFFFAWLIRQDSWRWFSSSSLPFPFPFSQRINNFLFFFLAANRGAIQETEGRRDFLWTLFGVSQWWVGRADYKKSGRAAKKSYQAVGLGLGLGPNTSLVFTWVRPRYEKVVIYQQKGLVIDGEKKEQPYDGEASKKNTPYILYFFLYNSNVGKGEQTIYSLFGHYPHKQKISLSVFHGQVNGVLSFSSSQFDSEPSILNCVCVSGPSFPTLPSPNQKVLDACLTFLEH